MTVRISDHALLRYLERAGGLDVESMREALSLSIARATAAAEAVGGGDYRIVADGIVYVVRNAVVVTVLHDGGTVGRVLGEVR